MKTIGFLSAMSLPLCTLSYAAAQDRPNIVFILADDLGWTDLGVMGSDYYETPHIDQLAAEGLLFDNAYASAANSAPSRACLMTGMYTPRHGVFTVSPSARGNSSLRKLIPIENTEEVRADFVTMAEALQQQGYTCGHVGKWHLGDDAEGTGPLSQGFSLNIAGGKAGSPYSYFYPYCNPKGTRCHVGLEQGMPGEYLTDRLTDEALKFVRDHRDGPFFLYLSHHAVHVPLKAPEQEVKRFEAKPKGTRHTNAVYAAMIAKLDESVGRVCRELDRLGIARNTLVVFFSDNGGSEPVTENAPLRGGKGTPYEGGTRVPLIFRWPGTIEAGTRTSVPVTGVDFYPTFVRLAQGKPAKELDGEDIFGLLRRPACQRDLFWHFPAYLESYQNSMKGFRATPYTAIREGDWKLIYFYETGVPELYNLRDDPGETHDLYMEMPQKARRLVRKLNKWVKDTHAPVPTELNPHYGK